MEQFSSEVGGQETNFSCIREKSNNLNEDLISEAMEDDSGKNELASVKHAADGKKINAIQNENKSAVSKHSLNESVRKGRSFQMVEPRKYLLRSSLDGARTLTSLSNDQNKTSTQPVVSDSVPKTKERRKKRNGKVVLNDEFSLTRKRIRYLLNRISYEQSLIDAYSYEGWRGQSLEKIRPEKELERAKSEILHRKLRIRESMHHLDSLLSEGRIEKNVSDDDDEIDSENIFCAKCGSKDSSVDNDIILCDGSCDRGFHQKCLKPPLHEIPPGDQGWLCPGCDCKVDCFDLLNEFQGSDLSIEDTWEKVFPEAAAIANGNKQDDSIYPSDDSEDDDYDPDIPEVPAEGQEEGSSSQELSSDESSEELDSTSLSEDSGPQKYNSYDVHGLPSDDSEDDDFDPENLNPNKNAHKEGSESDESDFTSDSDEFCAELCKVTNMDEVTSLNSKMAESYDEAYYTAQKDVNAGTSTVGAGLPIENSYPVSKKKLRDQLNYKKLYDEAYGKASSDSTKEEGWIEKGTPKEDDKDDDTKEYATLPRSGIESVNNQRSSTIDDIVFEAYPINIVRSDQPQIPKTMPETTPSKTHEYFGECGGTNGCNATASRRRHLDKKGASGTRQIVLRTLNNIDVVLMTFKAETFLHLPPSFAIHSKLQSLPRNSAPIRLWRRFLTGRLRANYRDFGCTKLLEIFKENHYPSRQMKESLAEELGVTIRQIGKWFENSRRSLRASVKGSSLQDDNRKESVILPDAANQSANTPTSLRSGGIVEEHPINMINSDQPQVSNAVEASTPSEPHQSMDEHHSDSSMHCPNGNKATPSRKHFGQKVYQKLQEIFTENQYPSSGVKKSLSEELGLSAKQISKWFEKSRSRQRISAMESNTPDAQASVSHSETNLQGAGQNTLSNSSRKNTNSGNRNTTSVTAKVSNAKTSSKKNNSTNQVGHATQGNKKIKRKEFDRHKALERELRKRRKIR